MPRDLLPGKNRQGMNRGGIDHLRRAEFLGVFFCDRKEVYREQEHILNPRDTVSLVVNGADRHIRHPRGAALHMPFQPALEKILIRVLLRVAAEHHRLEAILFQLLRNPVVPAAAVEVLIHDVMVHDPYAFSHASVSFRIITSLYFIMMIPVS